MKLSLTLKIALCLLLNLLLLVALGFGFLTAWGGFGWSALVTGPAGARIEQLGIAITQEITAAPRAQRDKLLENFAGIYGVKFIVLDQRGGVVAGDGAGLPEAVLSKLVIKDAPGGPGGPPDNFDDLLGPLDPEGDDAQHKPPPGDDRGLGPRGPRDMENNRFLEHSTDPSAYWIGLRSGHPPFVSRTSLKQPAALVVRIDSLWGLIQLLELQAWLFGAGAVLLVSVLFWLPLVRGMTHDIGELMRATERIAEGRFDTRVPARRNDELGRLGDSVNQMAGRLDKLVTGQRRFLGDVAHELCSPLARLQAGMGVLEERAGDQLQDTVNDVREEVEQMAEIVNDLLAFTRAGLGKRTLKLEDISLAALVEHVLTRENALDRCSLAVPEDLVLRTDMEIFSRALGNVVRNAIRYAGDAGPISVSVAKEKDGLRITVCDEGPGVPEEALVSLGEPFFRPETARTRESGGVGLGLAIVKGSMNALGGSVRFMNRNPRGLQVDLVHPLLA